jgi:hypothetical protein
MAVEWIYPAIMLTAITVVSMMAILFTLNWQRVKRFDQEMKRAEFDRTVRREEEEDKRLKEADEAANLRAWAQERNEEEALAREKAGAGAGGYVFVDLPDSKRSLFHDLLKGFEEYAQLKGYSVAFSIDSTFARKIAFKFTLTDIDAVLSTERVRKDLREYIDKISRGALIHELDDLPEIISMEEHRLIVTTLKNRITFLQVNFNLAKNTLDFYQNLHVRLSSQQFVTPSRATVKRCVNGFQAAVLSG